MVGSGQAYIKPVLNVTSLKQADLTSQSELSSIEVSVSQTPAPVTTGVCGSDPYMAQIYKMESGCNTASINSIGCAGIGQACPGSKLPCSLTDFVCQDAYFTAYSISRYGSTYAALQFHLANGWY